MIQPQIVRIFTDWFCFGKRQPFEFEGRFSEIYSKRFAADCTDFMGLLFEGFVFRKSNSFEGQ